jgi:hypothetical protein
VRRAGGGRKSAVTHQPGLPAALAVLIEDAIRGDPGSLLRWVSRSRVTSLRPCRRFQAGQRVVSNLLRDLKYSCQANQKTREGSNAFFRSSDSASPSSVIGSCIGRIEVTQPTLRPN